MPVIMDVVAAAVLLGFGIAGARRGLVRSVAGLVIVVCALVGAGIFSAAVTPVLSKSLQPYIEKKVEQRLDAALSGGVQAEKPQLPGESTVQPTAPNASAATPSPADGSGETDLWEKLEARRLLSLLGLDEDLTTSLAESAQQKVRDTGVSLFTAVAESAANSVVHILAFVLAFVVISLLLRVLLGAMGLVAKLPGLHLANVLLGGVLGLLEGALLAFLTVWILRRFGVSFDTAVVAETRLVQFFTTNTPLSALSFL